MSLFGGGQVGTAPLVTCEVCSEPAPNEVWGCRLCGSCFGAWWSDPRFAAGSVEAGLPAEPLEQNRRYCIEATRLTRAWVLERRAQP